MVSKPCILGENSLNNGKGSRAIFSPDPEIIGATTSTLTTISGLADNGGADILLLA